MHRLENQILLSSGSFAGMRETGGFGQPLHALYPQIRAVLASELGSDAAALLAEPVVDRANNRIDWYTEGDPDRSPTVLSDLPEEQRQPLLAQVHDWLERGRSVAERYAASEETRRAQLGAMLRAALSTPAETEIFLVEGRPVMIRWGFMPDRPWETLGEPARSPAVPPPAPKPVEPQRDVLMPEIALPELATASALASVRVDQSVPETGRQPPEASPPAPTPEPVPAAPLPEAPPASSKPALSPSPPESPLQAEPLAAARDASLKPPSGAGWRYIVVGSRYFWGVFALAVALVVMAALGWVWGRLSLSPAPGQSTRLSLDADLELALTQAQRTETELQTRLESLLAQLAGRRSQCPSPAPGAKAGVSAVQESGHGRTIPAQSTVVVADEESPRAPTLTAPLSDRAAVPTVDAPTADRAALSSGQSPAVERRATPSTATPVAPNRTVPSATTPPSSTAALPDDASPPPAKSAPHAAPAGRGTPTQALEEALVERAPAATALLQQPPLAEAKPPVKAEPSARTDEPPAKVEPPIKAEPTPEERQEFASRLSAAGATTGEITTTLLWNSPGDLDLVVRCPSGQQLDYRNPAACGGALDVDANAARASLSDRPVENAFWPAGRAAPGTYEIAVRYVPRKDEQNPRETPFQVRLIRGGQESVFKGAVRPNTVTPVTTFTVAR